MSIPYPTVPTYNLELPVSKTKVTFRPFLVKEEKILLLAKEQKSVDEVINAITQVMDLCTFGKIKPGTLPVADLEYLFIKVRERSIGEKITGTVDCKKCRHEQPYMINLDQVMVEDNTKSNIIKLDDKTVVTMKYPTISAAKGLDQATGDDAALRIAANLIESITIGDTVHDAADMKKEEIIDWLEHCTESQVQLIGEFLASLPKVVYVDVVPCKNCDETINVYVEGIESFFN